VQLNTSYGIAYNSLLQAITVQLTHPTAYLVHHTRVEIDFELRVAENQIPVHEVYNTMSSLFTRTSL
jgi:hypothetical protein